MKGFTLCLAMLGMEAMGVEIAGRAIDPLAPPLGFKTYRDFGVMVDENMLVREGPPVAGDGPGVYPLFDKANRIKVGVGGGEWGDAVWCAYSKDEGKTWSVPRFVAALTDGRKISGIEVRKATGRALEVSLGGVCTVRFKENDLRRLATAEDLRKAEAGRFVVSSVPSLCIGRDLLFETAKPPAGYRVDAALGLLVPESMEGQIVHEAQQSLWETRGVVTPGGDYLVMIPDGQHASGPRDKSNKLIAYRSSDQGKTWSGPQSAFGDDEKHHAALPLVPRGGRRIFVFETERGSLAPASKSGRALGFRTSDDDGRQWSPVELIRLANGATYGGTGVIQPTETEAGTWMWGFHHSKMIRGALEDGKRVWSGVAATEGACQLDELRVIALSGANVAAFGRTCEGHLWQMRSTDDGRTWSEAQPTTLVQPDGPPMIFPLSDRKKLIALHHNRAVLRSVHEPVHSDWLTMPTPTAEQIELGNRSRRSVQDWVSRAEIWFSLSTDEGRTWSEPRFLFANALGETLDDANPNYQCSYVDLFTDRGRVHLLLPHRWRRVIHLSFSEDRLSSCLTKDQLRHLASPSR